jgi:hypothetical protein
LRQVSLLGSNTYRRFAPRHAPNNWLVVSIESRNLAHNPNQHRCTNRMDE